MVYTCQLTITFAQCNCSGIAELILSNEKLFDHIFKYFYYTRTTEMLYY